MYYNLFLDDVRVPKQVTWVELPQVEWVIVRNYDDFKKVIESRGVPARISFDHDLGAEHYPTGEQTGHEQLPYEQYKEKTGYHCAQWLCDYCNEHGLELPIYHIHSLNIAGRENIKSYLEFFKNKRA